MLNSGNLHPIAVAEAGYASELDTETWFITPLAVIVEDGGHTIHRHSFPLILLRLLHLMFSYLFSKQVHYRVEMSRIKLSSAFSSQWLSLF